MALQLGSITPDHIDDVRVFLSAPSSLLLDDVATLFLETALAVAPAPKSIKDQSPVRNFSWRHFPQCLLPMTVCPIWVQNWPIPFAVPSKTLGDLEAGDLQ